MFILVLALKRVVSGRSDLEVLVDCRGQRETKRFIMLWNLLKTYISDITRTILRDGMEK
jgi:hypothetical protein